jgi:hypothetical protein
MRLFTDLHRLANAAEQHNRILADMRDSLKVLADIAQKIAEPEPDPEPVTGIGARPEPPTDRT